MSSDDYKAFWEEQHQRAYQAGRAHWRAELATPREFLAFVDSGIVPPGAKVLEIGCSDGLNPLFLHRQGYKVTGIDVSPSAIDRAQQLASDNGADITLLCRDAAAGPLDLPSCFDLWVDIKTLHCLWNDAARTTYYRNAFDALAPGGVFFLTCGLALRDVRTYFPEVFAQLDEPTRRSADDPLDRDLPADRRRGIRCETIEHYCRECQDAGFEILKAGAAVGLKTGWGVVLIARKSAALPVTVWQPDLRGISSFGRRPI